jgi:hypothetical protein
MALFKTKVVLTGLGVEDLRDWFLRLVELLKEIGGDRKEVNTSKGLDLSDLNEKTDSDRCRQSKIETTYVTERSTHDDSLVTVLLVVVEDFGDGLDTRVLLALVVLPSGLFVPVEDTADKGRNEGYASLDAASVNRPQYSL